TNSTLNGWRTCSASSASAVKASAPSPGNKLRSVANMIMRVVLRPSDNKVEVIENGSGTHCVNSIATARSEAASVNKTGNCTASKFATPSAERSPKIWTSGDNAWLGFAAVTLQLVPASRFGNE